MARHVSKPAPQRAGFFVFAGALLVLPSVAVLQPEFPVPAGLVAIVSVAVSLPAFLAHRFDKRRAESGGWRVPELTLHALELFGGWPGALLAQRLYRHKTSKVSYQTVFWLIVAAYQFLAADFLLGWRITQQVRVWLA